MSNKEQVAAVITPAIESLGFYVEDISITSAGRRSMLTVIVDGDTHLSLDQVTVDEQKVAFVDIKRATLEIEFKQVNK
jgi:ribosome maturation factor RimP